MLPARLFVALNVVPSASTASCPRGQWQPPKPHFVSPQLPSPAARADRWGGLLSAGSTCLDAP